MNIVPTGEARMDFTQRAVRIRSKCYPILMVGLVLLGSCSRNPLEEAQEEAFRVADDKVRPNSGEVASGNSDEAKILAEAISTGLQDLQAKAFTGASANHEGDKFLTHCRINPEQVVLLIHVPNLGDYESEAKDAIRALCWNVSQAALANASPETRDGKKLVVGIRGNFLYDTVLKADSIREVDIDQMDQIGSEVQKSSGQSELVEYFLDPQKAAELKKQMKQSS